MIVTVRCSSSLVERLHRLIYRQSWIFPSWLRARRRSFINSRSREAKQIIQKRRPNTISVWFDESLFYEPIRELANVIVLLIFSAFCE